MISSLKTISNGDTWITIMCDEKESIISYSSHAEYWDYADSDSIEYMSAHIHEDNVIVCATTAQGQGGVIGIWNAQMQKWIHISNGDYAVKAFICDRYVVTLCAVLNLPIPQVTILAYQNWEP